MVGGAKGLGAGGPGKRPALVHYRMILKRAAPGLGGCGPVFCFSICPCVVLLAALLLPNGNLLHRLRFQLLAVRANL